MKKLLLIGAMALATISMSAQDLAGKMFIGGAFGYSQGTKDALGNRDKDYSFTPLVGKFISSDVAVGVKLGYIGSNKGTTTSTGQFSKTRTNGFIVSPMLRKYFPIGGNGFYFFGEAALPIEYTHSNSAGYRVNNFDVNVNLNAGFDYILNERISFETSLNIFKFGYSNSNPLVKDVKSSNSMNFRFDPTKNVGDFTVGVKFLF